MTTTGHEHPQPTFQAGDVIESHHYKNALVVVYVHTNSESHIYEDERYTYHCLLLEDWSHNTREILMEFNVCSSSWTYARVPVDIALRRWGPLLIQARLEGKL